MDAQLARVDLTHRRDVRTGRISGRQRRRLDLATAPSADPELLFLHELTLAEAVHDIRTSTDSTAVAT